MRFLVLAGLLLLHATSVAADEILYLDGRHETADRVVIREDAVLVSMQRGMRSVARFEVVRVVRKDGTVVPIERKLTDRALAPAEEAALAGLAGAEGPALASIRKALLARPSKQILARLEAMAKARPSAERAHAARFLLLLGTQASVTAGVRVALEDKKPKVRAEVASALFEITGLLESGDFAAVLRPGLGHAETKVRATFALALGEAGDRGAIDVIKKDALGSSDHHMREQAAEVLASLGDDAGVGVLLQMLGRTRHPAGGDVGARLLIEEKIRVCGLLGKLGTTKALSALRKQARSKKAQLAAAAQDAIRAIEKRGE